MISMTYKNLCSIVEGELIGSAETKFSGVAIDSRNVSPKNLFIAIRGEFNDGHKFINEAVNNLASGIIVDEAFANENEINYAVPVVVVADSHAAMLTLAKYYRNESDAKVIAITGSNGKTTTKEFIYSLLKALNVNAYRSPGNLNNLFGVPLALFDMPLKSEIAVLECGISTMNEMPLLAELVRPDVVLITNVGASHIEFLKTVNEVAQAKLELYTCASEKVKLVINADDDILLSESKKVAKEFTTYALISKADYGTTGIDVDEKNNTEVIIEGHKFVLSLHGQHQVYNLLSAYAAVKTIGLSFENIETTSIQFGTSAMRGQQVEIARRLFLIDCYNANPASMKASLDSFFAQGEGSRIVLVIGDMLELGDEAEKYHRQLGAYLAAEQFDVAYLVGTLSEYVMIEAIVRGCDENKFKHFKTTEDAVVPVAESFEENDFIFIKGSRGMGLEKIVDEFKNRVEAA